MRIYRNAPRFAARCEADGSESPRLMAARRTLHAAASLVLPLLVAVSPPVQASDLAREGRIAAELAGAILEGDVRRLKAGEADFLAIDKASTTGETRGAVVLLHDRGAHPDWPDVIHPLRVGLPTAGWRTLSIQLPVAAADAPDGAYETLVTEAGPRIAAAATFLREGEARQPVVLVGHGLGARMASDYLASAPADSVQAFVAIGLPAGPREAAGTLDALAKSRVPTLDLYGGRDLDTVGAGAPARRQAAQRAGNLAYQQIEVPGADHAFTGMGDTLLARVRAWLHRVLPKGTGGPR